MADQNLKIRIQAIDTTQKIFRAVARRLNSLRKTVFSFRTALVSLAGAGGFGFLIKSSLDSIDKISKLSRTLGISVRDLRKLEYAADLSGLSVDTVSRAVRNLNRVMVDFQGGTGDAKDAFDALGITSDDLNAVMGDQFKVLELLADRFERVENSAVRSSIAQDLFGGRASEMLLVLEEGADGLAQISDEAERFGLLLSATAAKGVEDANDSFTRLFALLKGFRDQVTAALAPALENVVNAMRKGIEEILDQQGGVQRFARDVAISIVNAVETLANSLVGILRLVVGAVNAVIRAINFLNERLGYTTGFTKFNRQLEDNRVHAEKLFALYRDTPFEDTVKEFKDLANAQEFNVDKAIALKDALRDQQQQLKNQGIKSFGTAPLGMLARRLEVVIDSYNTLGNEFSQISTSALDASFSFDAARAAIDDMYNESLKATEGMDGLGASINNASDDGYVFGTGLKELAKNARNFSKNMEDVVIRGIESFEDALLGAVTGTMKLKDAFKQMAASIISDIIRMTIRMQISAPIAQYLAGAFPFGGTSTSSVFGTGAHPGEKRAMGGSVSAGQPYMVGERGAEMFIPGGSGTIIPSNQLGGGGTVVNQTINVSTGVSQTVRAEIMQLMPQIAEGTKAAVLDARRRGGTFAGAFGG